MCTSPSKSLITHREVGVDTHSWHHALKNTLRQAPDVILIGEIRDAETMEHAIAFAETGHLCLGTLHANSTNQTIDRIINFFPEERRNQLLMDLSANLRAIVSQRLVRTIDGKGRKAAIEILLNTPDHRRAHLQGRVSRDQGPRWKSRASWACAPSTGRCSTCTTRAISPYDEALRNADSANELRLNIKLKSRRGEPAVSAFGGLALEPEPVQAEVSESVRHEEMLRQHEARRRLEEAELAQLREKKRLAEAAAARR